jgi:hypothetical protein
MISSVLGRRLDLGVVVFRLVVVLAIVVGLCRIAVAQDNAVPNAMADFFGDYQISCRSLVVTEYIASDNVWDGKAEIKPFSLKTCEKLLPITNPQKIFAPVVDHLSPLFTSSNIDTTKLSASEIKQKIQKEELAMKRMVMKLHQNAEQLAETCRKIIPKTKANKQRVCYFGAPEETSGSAFKSLFQMMISNALPSNEAICTDDPIIKGQNVVSQFRALLGNNEQRITWHDIKLSVEKDHFHCLGDDCARPMIAIQPVSPDDPNFKIGKEAKGFLIISRQIILYRGKWHALWPYKKICVAGEECQAKPESGVAEGICTQTDSSEGSGYMVYGLNAFE